MDPIDKPNDPQSWIITLYGSSANNRIGCTEMEFTGRLDEALSAADEMESNVDFEVTQYVIRRSEMENADYIAEMTQALYAARRRLLDRNPRDVDHAVVSKIDRALTLVGPKRYPGLRRRKKGS